MTTPGGTAPAIIDSCLRGRRDHLLPRPVACAAEFFRRLWGGPMKRVKIGGEREAPLHRAYLAKGGRLGAPAGLDPTVTRGVKLEMARDDHIVRSEAK